MPTLFRLYTENKNRRLIEDKADRYFDSFTVYDTTGYWKGKLENSIVIELISTETRLDKMRMVEFANIIKEMNGQESVLLTCQEIESELI